MVQKGHTYSYMHNHTNICNTTCYRRDGESCLSLKPQNSLEDLSDSESTVIVAVTSETCWSLGPLSAAHSIEFTENGEL